MNPSTTQADSDRDNRDYVLRIAVDAAKSQIQMNMCTGDAKQYTPTEAAVAVVEAYRAAVKALDAPEHPASD